MQYDIFKCIPHQRITSKRGSVEEQFDLYQCGLFKTDSLEENLELVELQPQTDYCPHFHKNSSAVIYIILGVGQIQLAETLIEYHPGLRIDIPAHMKHGFKTQTITLFLSIQSPPIIDADTGELESPKFFVK